MFQRIFQFFNSMFQSLRFITFWICSETAEDRSICCHVYDLSFLYRAWDKLYWLSSKTKISHWEVLWKIQQCWSHEIIKECSHLTIKKALVHNGNAPAQKYINKVGKIEVRIVSSRTIVIRFTPSEYFQTWPIGCFLCYTRNFLNSLNITDTIKKILMLSTTKSNMRKKFYQRCIKRLLQAPNYCLDVCIIQEPKNDNWIYVIGLISYFSPRLNILRFLFSYMNSNIHKFSIFHIMFPISNVHCRSLLCV